MNKIKKIIAKKNKSKIVCLTSYSKSVSKILDKYCDIILVGDSLGNVLYGMKNTHKVSLQMMIDHAVSAKQGCNKSLLVVDMPKGTYKNSKIALKNAKKIMVKTKCDAIKIESNSKNFDIIKHLVKSKINVMGHIGYTPQIKKKFKVEGRNPEEINRLIVEANKIERAGAFSIVLECVSSVASKKITDSLKIPTIGIGSSLNCDGQILVTDDLLGLSGFYPKFVKRFANISKIIDKSIQKYKTEVIKKKFPSKKNTF